MGWYSKVVWSEGLFLRPQLFQQQERYLEHYAHKRCAALTPFFWGFSHFEIDAEAQSLGKLVVKSAAGVFADGTPFDAPGHTPSPAPLTIRSEHLEQTIYLAAPIRVPNGEETVFADSADSLARYQAFDHELRDANSIGQGPKLVQLSGLRMRLLPEKELTQSWIGLAVARVTEIRGDGSIRIDPNHTPPVTGYGASDLLRNWLTQIHGLTHLRADALAQRLSGSDGRGGEAADVSDYLLLQLLNRYEPLLQHRLRVSETSPETVYAELTSFAGELSTFVRSKTRRPLDYPAYRHENPYGCIKPVVDDLQLLLNEVLIRSAQRIELEERAHGIRLAVVNPSELERFASVVLGVSAQLPADVLQQQFAAQTKVGPSERLPELLRSHLPGVVLQALPVPPRQIPFNAGYVYYELTKTGPLWEQVAKHGGLAMHIAGEFPGLRMELWGVRDK
ncbi:type VI secretion system baseplate subunit TssK [Burkholderia pyrrocinia]|uniref:type VI secretion system baseplate subunit TssK n=1 Tax=Burkholderia pyrrocinia TaxID=60550 RepID=UPI0015772577|nr:type VI secretion system baseplate subunit TssK [Burkholderia pyrrocinia]NTX26631.1 type VI secretion system baseplate subunit TssK [Burkholderia pyrrocinia]QVN23417.1 type VI secretion system baseplate subunit TssK [Burkholderia pyrrocinia]